MDDNLDSQKHREQKSNGTPEWTETCIGIWIKQSKEHGGKTEEERRICRGISILHLNKYANPKKVKSIPTQGIEIVISEGDETCSPRNIHPFLGIFVDEQEDAKRDVANVESHSNKPSRKSEEDKLKDPRSDEASPRIIRKVAENWSKRTVNAAQKIKKYYQDPSSSAEVITGMKNTVTNGYESTCRILSYCQPRQKVKQVSSFVAERARSISKWWSE